MNPKPMHLNRPKWANTLLAVCLACAMAPALADNAPNKLSSEDFTKAKASLELINSKLGKASKSKAQIKLVESDDINIGAAEDDASAIAVTTALVLQFADDRDAMASLIARQQSLPGPNTEQKPEAKKSPTVGKLMGMLGSAVGGAVDSKIGVSGASQTLTEGGSEIINSIGSQAQDKSADEASVNWMLDAGYNPHGALRAQKKLLSLSDAGKTSKLSAQHPVSADKVAYIEALIDDNAKAKAMSADSKSPLWGPAKATNSAAPLAAVAATAAPAVAGSSEAVSTTASTNNDSIDGTSLSRFAVIKNDVAFLGESQALAKHSLTADGFKKLDQEWSARMAQDKGQALAQRYAMHYLEASQGEFADWGIDVAQIKQTGRLQLGTDPTGVDDWIVLHKAHRNIAAGGADAAAAFTKAAKEKGMSDYDFNIVNAWWTQRAKDRAAKGDKTLVQRMN